MVVDGIVEIGNTLKLRPDIDPGSKVTKWFRQGLNIVDIIPANYSLNLDDKKPSIQVYNTGGGTVKPIEEYQNRCSTYGLEAPKMVRAWLTGDSSFQEELSTEYQTNKLESVINGVLGGALGSYANLFKTLDSASGNNSRKIIIKEINDKIKSAAGFISGGDKNSTLGKAASAISKISGVLVNNLLDHKFLSIPKTYSGSSYNPALNFNIRLISPYGHPKAIQKFIVEPLTYLLLLAPPSTNDGITYGNSSYVSVKAYGIADIDLAIIENISIKRGGNDVAYNKHRQPLSIDVNLSIKPAASGFASEEPGGDFQDKALAVDVALDLANSTVAKITSSSMRSSMVTIGNMLESFKKMPFPDTDKKSPPVIKTVKPPKPANSANNSVSANAISANNKTSSIV